MSLLTQFGIMPISRKSKTGVNIGQCYLSVGLKKVKMYTLSLNELVKSEKLDWPGIDIAFSKQHGGIFIAKGDTFKFNKKERYSRIDSSDIYHLFFNSFCIKKPKQKARILLSYEMFSQDVYIFKIDKIDYNI